MFTVDIERMIPKFLLNDKNGYAIAKALEAALQKMNDIVQCGVGLIVDYDTMPEWRLDELAWELAVDWYDMSAPIDVKRRTIAKAAEFYIKLGTPGIMRNIVESIQGSGSIEEWYQYGGSPYHFTVYADGSIVTKESDAKLKAMIEKGKNLRSVMDQIYYTTKSKAAEMWALTSITGIEGYSQGTARLEED